MSARSDPYGFPGGGVQGYLDHKKTPHTVAYAYGPTAVQGGGRFLISVVPLLMAFTEISVKFR